MNPDRVLTEIYVPAIGRSFDIWMPSKSSMREVTILVSRLVGELSDGQFRGTDDTVLADRVTGKIFDGSFTIESLGIRNGSRLMLF